MEAVRILQAILDNQVMPHRVNKLHGIFRCGKFLTVTDGHAALCIKSEEKPATLLTGKGVVNTITAWLKPRSSGKDISFVALKAFIACGSSLPAKCNKCDEEGEVGCTCKNGCKRCDYECLISCKCGYNPFPSDPVVLGNKVYNRYLLQVFTAGLAVEKFRYIDPDDPKEKLIIGDTDWRLFVMPMHIKKEKTMPVFKWEDYVLP